MELDAREVGERPCGGETVRVQGRVHVVCSAALNVPARFNFEYAVDTRTWLRSRTTLARVNAEPL